jgi:serine/threonine protein kinase
MLLTPGTRLGPYEIVAPLGAGGMGEVFRATDTRLGREVAIKVLPQHLSANPEVRARFEREAKTVSSAESGIRPTQLAEWATTAKWTSPVAAG